MSTGTLIAYSFIPTAILIAFWYGASIVLRRNDIADIGWAGYFIATAWTIFFLNHPAFDIRLVPLLLVSIWGLRLMTHIAKRFAHHTDEDPRYKAWRNTWGNGWYFYLRSLFQVFILQGILAWIIVLPVTWIMFSHSHIPLVSLIIGACVWLCGFICESVADTQLKKFLADPQNKGQIMQTGLWHYSRHPNYFGEVTQWFGLWIMALPGGWFTLIGPALLYFLIVHVSGIPLAEEGMKNNPAFQAYQAQVSPLVPLPRWVTNFASPRTLASIMIEFGPLLLFFVTFEVFDFFTSVAILIGAVMLALYGSKRVYGKFSLFPVLSSGSVIIFGLITVISRDPFWIIFKDTLYFGIFGLAIVIPLLFKKLVLKELFDQMFAITDRGWSWVSWNWGIFMIMVAVSNEIVRVRLTPADWVHYKMVVLIILIIFSLMQFAISSRERLPEASILGLRK